jgi:hypothetical protein
MRGGAHQVLDDAHTGLSVAAACEALQLVDGTKFPRLRLAGKQLLVGGKGSPLTLIVNTNRKH